MTTGENPIVELSAQESWKPLENGQHGRIALSIANEPDIYPINFVARNGFLTMRTNPRHEAGGTDHQHQGDRPTLHLRARSGPLLTGTGIQEDDGGT